MVFDTVAINWDAVNPAPLNLSTVLVLCRRSAQFFEAVEASLQRLRHFETRAGP
jgi:hypothetical protein